MQIVINVPKGFFYSVQDGHLDSCIKFATEAILNGTIIPENHGKIGDLDRLYEVFKRNVAGAVHFKQLFDNAPTILEADSVEMVK